MAEIVLCSCLVHSTHTACRTNECSCFAPKTSNSSYISGRDLSKFDQDILKILCAVLMHTGPVHITSKDIETLDVDQLVVEAVQGEDKFIVSYGEAE